MAKKPKGLPFAPLPGKQLLMPGYWTMQLMVTNVTNVTDSASHYLTRYRTNIDLSKRNSSGSPIVEKRCIHTYIYLLLCGFSFVGKEERVEVLELSKF